MKHSWGRDGKMAGDRRFSIAPPFFVVLKEVMSMELLEGHELATVTDNVIALWKRLDKELAISIAVNMARGFYRQEHPETFNWPPHLTPGNCIKSINAELKKRGAVDGK